MNRSVSLILKLAEKNGIADETLKEIRINLCISVLTAICFVVYFGMMVISSCLSELEVIPAKNFGFYDHAGELLLNILIFVCYALIIYVFWGYALAVRAKIKE